MTYTVIMLVDGNRVSSNRNVKLEDLEYHTELTGPELNEFIFALKMTGKAVDVRRDPFGVTVVIAHEET